MKNLILILSVLLTSCSTLGFGDFSDKKAEINTGQVTKIDESSSGKIPVKFTIFSKM